MRLSAKQDFRKLQTLTLAYFRTGEQTFVTMPNFIKIGRTFEGIWRFNSFQNAAVCYLSFLKFNFLAAGAVKRPILYHHTKFPEDRPKIVKIAIFVIVNKLL